MNTRFAPLLISLALLLVALPGFAQLRYGIKGGTNLTVITKGGNFYESVKPAPGYQFGGYVKLFPNSPVYLQAEAMYIQNTFNAVFPADTLESGGQALYAKTIDLKQQNAYINIPVLMYIKIVKGLDISVGPQLALLTKAVATGQEIYDDLQGASADSLVDVAWNYLKDEAGEGAYAADSTLDQGKFFNPAALDINLGATLSLTKALKVELRTNYGLLSAINDYYKAGFDVKKINRTFGAQLNVVIEFGGGKN